MTKVLALNTHNDAPAIKWVSNQSYAVALLSEVNKVSTRPVTGSGRTYLTGPRERGRNMQRETGISTLVPVLGHRWDRICENAGAQYEKLAPDRYAQSIHAQVGSATVDFYSIHLDAAPHALRQDNPNHPVVREYRQSLRWLHAALTASQQQGRQWVVGGDVNLRAEDDVPWSPHAMLYKMGATIHDHGLDLIAVSRSLTMSDKRVYPREVTHSDHPALSAVVGLQRAEE